MTPGAWLRQRFARLVASPQAFVLGESRLAVLDIDVSGIDFRRDRSTGIAVLPLAGNAFRLADLAYCHLPTAQAAGEQAQARRCYQALTEVVGDGPVLTFNPNFVRHMLERTLAELGLPVLRCEWVDFGAALEGAFGREMGQGESLQFWQRRLQVDGIREHAAVADVFAMAQLFEMLVARCEETGLRTLKDLVQAQKSHIWLRGD